MTPTVGSTLLRFWVKSSTVPSPSIEASIRSPLPARYANARPLGVALPGSNESNPPSALAFSVPTVPVTAAQSSPVRPQVASFWHQVAPLSTPALSTVTVPVTAV